MTSSSPPCASLYPHAWGRMGGVSELMKWDGREKQAHGGHVERIWRGQGESVEKLGEWPGGGGGHKGTLACGIHTGRVELACTSGDT